MMSFSASFRVFCGQMKSDSSFFFEISAFFAVKSSSVAALRLGVFALNSRNKSMKLEDKKRELQAALGAINGPQERLGWLVERARERPLMPVELRVDAHRVYGCMSRLWLVAEFRDGRCSFTSESDSLIVKAIAGLLCDLYSDQTPNEIVSITPDFLAELGINQHLTPNRRNALSSVWEKIRSFAEARLTAQ
jgi:cysteine desulfuration protein SufE